MKIKQFLSIALALGLLTGMHPGAIPNARAEDTTTTLTQAVGSKATMEVSVKVTPPHKAHDDVDFTMWGNDEALEQYQDNAKTASNCLPLVAGCYYLTEDVALSSTWVVPDGETSLCLNNKQIIASGNFDAISIGANATLKIYEGIKETILDHFDGRITHAEGKSGLGVRVDGGTLAMYGGNVSGNSSDYGGVIVNNGSLIMNGGSISNNYSKENGGGVNLNGGTLTMNGGSIGGNKSESNAGGVCLNSGTLTMNGGNIEGNQSVNNAGGVCLNSGTLTMNGGYIGRNTSDNNSGGVRVCADTAVIMNDGSIGENTTGSSIGGGVRVEAEGAFTMNGGSINENHADAQQGGGVYICPEATFTMTDGSINNNSASYGGGVYIDEGAVFTMRGGNINANESSSAGASGLHVGGEMNLSGNVSIKDNKYRVAYNGEVERVNCNVQIPYGKKINITGPLTCEMPIGVVMNSLGVFTNGWSTHMRDQDPDMIFRGNNEGSLVKAEDGELKLELDPTYFEKAIKTLAMPGGEVSAKVNGKTRKKAAPGDMVTVTINPDDGYSVASLRVMNALEESGYPTEVNDESDLLSRMEGTYYLNGVNAYGVPYFSGGSSMLSLDALNGYASWGNGSFGGNIVDKFINLGQGKYQWISGRSGDIAIFTVRSYSVTQIQFLSPNPEMSQYNGVYTTERPSLPVEKIDNTHYSFTMPDDAVDICGVFDPYNIIFNPNGGMYHFSTKSVRQTVAAAQEVWNELWEDVFGMSREGFEFVGMFEKDAQGNLMDKPFDIFELNPDEPLERNIELFAKWKGNTYYNISVSDPASIQNGTLACGYESQRAGEYVTLTATPDEGCATERVYAIDANLIDEIGVNPVIMSFDEVMAMLMENYSADWGAYNFVDFYSDLAALRDEGELPEKVAEVCTDDGSDYRYTGANQYPVASYYMQGAKLYTEDELASRNWFVFETNAERNHYSLVDANSVFIFARNYGSNPTKYRFEMPACDVVVHAVFQEHVHSFTYTSDGTAITAACTEDCPVKDGLTVSLSAPASLNCDGSPKAATLSEGYNPEAFPGPETITYMTQDETPLDGAPVEPGTYTATYTVGEASISVVYTIDYSEVLATAEDYSGFYDGEGHTFTVNVTDPIGDYTIKFGTAEGTYDLDESPSYTDAGEYTVYYQVSAPYYNSATGSGKVSIAKAYPSCTIPQDLTADYGQKLADVALPEGWAWVDSTLSVGEPGTNAFFATYTPSDTDNYLIATEMCFVTVSGSSQDPTPEPVPESEPDLVLPASLTRIDAEAFAGGAFEYAKLPEGVKSIGARAFADCAKLKYVYIPAATTEIDESAFANVSGLTILGASGSAAQTFAENNGFTFAVRNP